MRKWLLVGTFVSLLVLAAATVALGAMPLPAATPDRLGGGSFDCARSARVTPAERRGMARPSNGSQVDYIGQHPDAFGGVMGPDQDGVTTVLVLEDHPASDPVLWAGSVTGTGDLVIRCVTHPTARLESLRDRMSQTLLGQDWPGLRAIVVRVDVPANTVVVEAERPSLLGRTVLSVLAGLDAPVVVVPGDHGFVTT